MRYEAFIGFNTKQLWLIDGKEKVLIDPPKEVLDSLPNWREDPDEAEAELERIANEENPDWLFEKDFWYDIETEV